MVPPTPRVYPRRTTTGACLPLVKRLIACLIAALVVAGLAAPVSVAAARPPKVVLIVGPVGPEVTARFRAQAREAAEIARRFTPDVTELYSPDATWPAVREALQGASVVVYLGHGNGWPSRYRDHLFPPSQNGFGLNPVAGAGDSRHQYFGEKYVGSEVKLAKNAVVLLHHLCYASGNTEPGLPVGTFQQSKQRVDNYAAGFIQAGASAVIADALSSPAYNVRSVLRGDRSIERIWRSDPGANGNVIAFESKRSPGFVAQMDPDRPTSGFHRSIVLKAGLASADVLAGARGNAAPVPSADPEPDVPSLIPSGIEAEQPAFATIPTAATETQLVVRYTIEDRDLLPKKIQVSARWDAIDVAPPPVDPSTEVPPAAEPEASPTPDEPPTPTTEPSATPAPSGEPVAGDDPDGQGVAATDVTRLPGRRAQPRAQAGHEPLLPPTPPETYTLVQPERLGDVVEPVRATVRKKRLGLPVTLPAAPGLYRLTLTLHDPDGIAYDAATQALLPTLLVRVVGQVDARILVTPEATLEAGSIVPLDLRVANLGAEAWGREGAGGATSPDGGTRAEAARVTGHWIALDANGTDAGAGAVATTLPAGLAGSATAEATLVLDVPRAPGAYLLVLDVVTPADGSLAALGVTPAMVRVTVIPPP